MLRKLTEAFGTSGCEKEVRDIVTDAVSSVADSVETDNLGNVIAFKKGCTSQKSVLLSCHTDESGFIVSDITDDGYLRFKPIGDICPESIVSKRVKINGLFGVIAFKAIHLTTKKEREQAFKFSDLLIDIGASDKSEAEKHIRVGDVGGFVSDFAKFGDNFIKGKALDSRTGCAIITDLLKKRYNADIYAVFATCGKTEHRGLTVASKKIKADFALNIDAFDCGESVRLGCGAALPTVFSNGKPTRNIVKTLNDIAEKNEIGLQMFSAAKRTGGSILSDSASAADVIIPIKYENSPSSIMSENDYAAARNLIDLFLKEI